MQTFKQFIETREVRDDFKDNYIETILKTINDKKLIVEFALYCAEDSYKFIAAEERALAKQCIKLIKKWLNNPNSVTTEELTTTSDNAWNVGYDAVYDAASNAIFSIYYAVNSVINAIANSKVYIFACASANSSANAFACASGNPPHTPEWLIIANQKRQEYTNKAKFLTTSRKGNPIKYPFINSAKEKTKDKIQSILALLDYLEEEGELGKNHFFYQDEKNKFVLDFGHGEKLSADSKEKLAFMILKNKLMFAKLQQIYQHNN